MQSWHGTVLESSDLEGSALGGTATQAPRRPVLNMSWKLCGRRLAGAQEAKITHDSGSEELV